MNNMKWGMRTEVAVAMEMQESLYSLFLGDDTHKSL
jgi:hypothetical protein